MTKNQKYQSTNFFRVEPLIASTITPTLHSPTPTLESEIDGRRKGDGEREVTETRIVYVCVSVPVRLCLYVYSDPLFGGGKGKIFGPTWISLGCGTYSLFFKK